MGQSILFAVLLLTLAAAGCQANCDNHDHLCYLYPSYQRLEAFLCEQFPDVLLTATSILPEPSLWLYPLQSASKIQSVS